MPSKDAKSELDPEIEAITNTYESLKGLVPEAQERVLSYVLGKLGIEKRIGEAPRQREEPRSQYPEGEAASKVATHSDMSGTEGISPVAVRWMARAGITVEQIAGLFSIGLDEIDLVAKSVPGKKLKERMHSVLLLKGIGAYLASGAPRVTHEQVKEACLHYDAYDRSNFAAYLKSFASEIGGAKESGHTLTAKGLTSATELIKSMVAPKS